MKAKYLFIIVMFFPFLIFGQTKYYVYFKDKGENSNTKLNKSALLFSLAEKELSAEAIERRKQVMGDNFITYEDLPLYSSYIQNLEQLGIQIRNKLKWFNAVTCYLTQEQLGKISKLAFVEKLEPVKVLSKSLPIENKFSDNTLYKTTSINSLDYGYALTQDNLSEIPPVHDLGFNGQGVIIGILDTGFRWKNHPALKNLNIIAEKDFVQNDDVTENQNGDALGQDSHGTACLSIMAGYDPGKLIGPAFGAKIILAKTENISSETQIEEDNYAAALEWMENLGVQLTTSSLGYNEFDSGIGSYTFNDMNGQTTIVAKAINLAFNRGVSTFTAAGNERNNLWGKIISPGDAFNVLTVGAVTSKNVIASFSSPGPTSDGRIKPEIVAMGVSDFHAVAGGTYGSGNGTSYATPLAAGIGALLKSTWPHLTNKQIRKIIIESGDNLATPDNDRGYGLISAKKAVEYPNLMIENGLTKLNKIFIDMPSQNSSSAKVYYNIDNGSFQSSTMNYDGVSKYSFTFPSIKNGALIKFYFTYNNNLGTEVREPSSDYYYLTFSDLLINHLEESKPEVLPTDYNLHQNYPNPFNGQTIIRYEVPKTGLIKLILYDVLGNQVSVLVDEIKTAGYYEISFPRQSKLISSGVYFYSLITETGIQTKKMVLLK